MRRTVRPCKPQKHRCPLHVGPGIGPIIRTDNGDLSSRAPPDDILRFLALHGAVDKTNDLVFHSGLTIPQCSLNPRGSSIVMIPTEN